ncbi:DUF4855 domain-containing protein [Thermococcus sp.]|uniref:DUF4855 domain-containing protein n=1 Tax=Thermococcus sp. TaxID=35749 RepID=UPI00261544BA|nr:DUF4855 domain-containing protein [Thermococcus sp.]
MAKFALWWVTWNGSDYESRMTVGSRKATVEDFKERGFDRIVILSGEGRGIKYSGPFYNSGYNDGREFARWVSNYIYGMPVYITIPFSRPEGFPRDQVQIPFEYSGVNSYYKGWIDGVLSVDNTDITGFYWSYESCLQTTSYDEAHVTKEFIQYMSNYIHNHGQEFIWIPATGDRGVTYLRKDSFDGILNIGGYFDYVFVQPNYYQNGVCIEYINGHKQTFPYSYEKLVEKIRWVYEELPRNIKNPNTRISIEMEADRTILGIPCNCGNGYNCPEGMKCDCNLEKCYEHCREHQPQKAIDYALDYVRALNDVGWKPSNLAYYFSTDFKVIDTLQEQCRRELNEPYV